jgi:hypothetical protein
VITGLPEKYKIRQDGLEVVRDSDLHGDDDHYALLTLDTVIVHSDGYEERRWNHPITKRQFDYLEAAVSQPRQETIRVKIVAGQLTTVPRGEHGWAWEQSVHEGSTITYQGRRYVYTEGRLVEQTEEVRG